MHTEHHHEHKYIGAFSADYISVAQKKYAKA